MENLEITEFDQLFHLAKPKEKLLIKLVEFIRQSYKPDEKIKYSKKNDNWTVFFKRGGKSLCYIEVRRGGFRVTVVIGATLQDKVAGSDLTLKSRMMFEGAIQFHDGKWLTYDVDELADIEDIKKLLLIKKNPVR